MASFTDQLVSFNPYVQQLPIQEMVSVGMQKQQQYNQGIERIQSQIDTIAGWDIARDVDKQYLQSRLNQLGGDLKKVAAGDFSNFQLQNSVGGMINKIGKDSNIQNAIISTQYIRKGEEELTTSRKEGKSSPENEWWWNNQVNSFLADPDLKSSFRGKYIQYKDVDGKLRTIAEKIHEVDNSIDIPYRRGGDGQILYDENNNPLIDDAMLRIKVKGKSAEKILSNFYTSLDESDKQQLMITANYHYRNADKDTLKADVRKNYTENKQILSDSLVSLNLDLQTNPRLTSTQKAEIEAKINTINSKLTNGSLEADLYREMGNIDNVSNLTDYKYKLYTQQYLTNLAKDMSYQSYQQEIVNNPYTQMGMEKARLQFQYDNANREQRNWELSHEWDKAKFFAKESKDTGASKPAIPGRLSTGTELPTLSDIEKKITSILGNKKTGEMGQIDELNAQYAPLITDSSLSTPEQKLAYLNGLSGKYSEDSSTIEAIKDPNVREYLEQRRALEIQAALDQRLYDETVEASKKFDKQLDDVYKGEKGIVDSSGREIYSVKELSEMVGTINKKFSKVSPSPFGFSTVPTLTINVQGVLNEYKGTKMEPLANAYIKRELKQQLSGEEKAWLERAQEVSAKFTPETRNIAERKLKFQSNHLAKHMPEYQTSVFTLDVNNSKVEDRIDEDEVEALLGAKFSEYEDLGGVDVEKFVQFDPSTIAEFKKDKEAVYTIEKKYDGSANLRISSGGKQQIVPMNASEFRTFFPNYARTNPIQNIKYAIMSSAKKTTNFSGNKNDAVNAYITGYQLPQLANTGLAPLVRADVEGNVSGDKYVIRMYVNENGTWLSDIITQKGFVNEATLQAALQEIGPRTVADLLKKNKK